MCGSDLEKRAVDARREYYRMWRKKNPDRVRANNQRYWEKQALLKMKKDRENAEEGGR